MSAPRWMNRGEPGPLPPSYDSAVALWRWSWEVDWPTIHYLPDPPGSTAARDALAVMGDAAQLSGDLGTGLTWLSAQCPKAGPS